MKARLIFPPQFEPFQPYLSGPYLKGLLCRHGICASVFDANLDFYEWLVAFSGKSPSWRTKHGPGADYLSGQVPEAVSSLRRTPISLSTYRWSVNVADEYLRVVSPLRVKIGLTYLKVGNRYSSSDLKAYLDKPDNIFCQYFDDAAERILGSSDVSIYLLSLVVIDQLAAAIAFTREIKRQRPGARVFIGGPIVSRLYRQLSAIPWIAQTFDAIAPGEAYRVLPSLLGLPDTFAGHVTPDFSDLDLDRYWSCRRVLPYLVAHGCKWGKCTFCSHHLTYDGYRASHISEVLKDLEYLSARHQAQYISFCDEYLTPEQLEELATDLLERGVDLRWSTFARPEPRFRDREFMHKLYAAGCRMLMFGLESGSQRVIQAMKKGTRVADFRLILEACKEANIAIRYDFMVGFPGETEGEAQQTYDFIRQNRDVIDTPFSSYSVAIFELRSGIPVLLQIDKFHVLPKSPLRGDLDDQYEFESEGGLSEESRVLWRERLIRFSKTQMDAELICPQNKTHQLILKDLYDRGELSLPVLTVEPHSFAGLTARFAPGVEVERRTDALRIVNHANGGELEVSLELADVVKAFADGSQLDVAFRSQDVWNEQVFTRFVSFLFRNDYLVIEPHLLTRDHDAHDRTILAAVG